jgi:hypothetical protein
MFKRTILALSAAALLFTGPVLQAQENATLVLRSGERISGQLVDLNASGFQMKVNGQDRAVTTGDVAIIEFGGGNMTAADWAKVNDGQHVVWLKDGQTVSGQLFDIGGTSPLRLTFKTNSGDRSLTSSEVSRIVLARTSDAPAATTGTSQGNEAGVSVSARQAWTPTGITVRRGQTVTLNTTGEIKLGPADSDAATAAGSKAGRYAQNAPLPQSLAGALIGKVGVNGKPFGIGDQTSIPMPAAGQLFLGINDDDLNNNEGEFRVQITTSGSPVRRR